MRNNLLKNLFSLLCFSIILIYQGSVDASVGGILIPYYGYPTPAAIQPLITQKQLHPNVPMRVILNPASGPGTTVNTVYRDAINSLKLAGIQVAGYVNTSNNARSLTDVKGDISRWYTLYHPDGIFLDSMGTNLSYYTTLTAYIKSFGMQFSIGNAGGNVSTTYTTAVDTVIISTNNVLPNLTNYTNWSDANIPKTEVGMLLYNISTYPTGFIYEAKKFVGWLYITNTGGMAPWNVFPTYFATLMNSLDTVEVGTIFPLYFYPDQSAIQPLLDMAHQYPTVPIWVILDPADGPGTSIDPTYTSAIKQLRAAGINLLGYVNTNFSQRAKTLVNSDIQTWKSFYKPDGIFLDLMNVNHTYYSSVTTYAKSLGFQMVIGNPGENIDPSSGNDVDIVMIWENSYLPYPLSQFSNWYSIYSRDHLSLIAYDVSPLPTTFITEAAQYFGWILISDKPGPSPYENGYPSYWASFIQLLSTL